MQSAETVLGVLRERGRRGLPCDELYRQLFNKELYLLAYGRIYSNKGAMTPGVDAETADGMSLGKIDKIVEAMRRERYRFRPVRRVYIPKKSGKRRPLGLPSWSDKLVGEVMRLLLEAYYEPTFSDRSHGYRPGRGCHTALSEVAHTWTGTTWLIEGDISRCFDNLDHRVLLGILREKIRDERFLRLLANMLQAGYLEDWNWNATLSGVPQGGVVSPLLSNIYLHRLDNFVETVLLPRYTRGDVRKFNRTYRRALDRRRYWRERGNRQRVRRLTKELRRMPSGDPQDFGFRRLRYIRYADDVLFGFIGPKAAAEKIKQRLAQFLSEDLALELSQVKTLITHARTDRANFLGYQITTQHNDSKLFQGQRSLNGSIALHVPPEVVKAKCSQDYRRGKPAHRNGLINEGDYLIVNTFAAEWRGIVNYYLLAQDVSRLNRLRWVMQTSMLKTLAAKHDSTLMKMKAKHMATIHTAHGPRRCYEAIVPRGGGKPPLVARFGGIPLKRKKDAVLPDAWPPARTPRKELITRLRRGRCEMCKHKGDIEVHHVAKLADLGAPEPTRPAWAEYMAQRRRKTLMVCKACHEQIHHGPPTTAATTA